MSVINHKPRPPNSVRLRNVDLIHVNITSTILSSSMNMVEYGYLNLFG